LRRKETASHDGNDTCPRKWDRPFEPEIAHMSCDVDALRGAIAQALAGVSDRLQIGMAVRPPPNELSERSHETFGPDNSVVG
jgi:hypothetical protein